MSGQLTEGRDAAREVLRRLPADDYARRAVAARFCALMERQLDRPQEARAVLLSELHRIPDPQSAAAVPLRTRLVAESLMRGDIRAAQAVLDLIPEGDGALEPSVAVAIAALRPMPAFALGRIADAARFIEAAGQLVSGASDDELADWLDAIAWLCWTETMMGRYADAMAHFDRAVAIARSSGQGYIISNLLAGQAQAQTMTGRLEEASAAAEEAAEVARLLGSGHQLVFALAQQCLAASWSGADETAVRLGEEAVRTGYGSGEWSGAQAQYALAVALINAGRRDAGRDAMARARGGRMLDRRSLLSACELMAGLEADCGNPGEASRWADRAAKVAYPGQEATARLARAHALRDSEPGAAATAAAQAAQLFDGTGQLIDAGRARLCAGLAWAAAGDTTQARDELAAAARTFADCGARSLSAATAREQRKLGIRVPGTGRGTGAHGLTQRELDVVKLVGEGYTNQQIADIALHHRPDRGNPPVAHLHQARRHHPDRHPEGDQRAPVDCPDEGLASASGPGLSSLTSVKKCLSPYHLVMCSVYHDAQRPCEHAILVRSRWLPRSVGIRRRPSSGYAAAARPTGPRRLSADDVTQRMSHYRQSTVLTRPRQGRLSIQS